MADVAAALLAFPPAPVAGPCLGSQSRGVCVLPAGHAGDHVWPAPSVPVAGSAGDKPSRRVVLGGGDGVFPITPIAAPSPAVALEALDIPLPPPKSQTVYKMVLPERLQALEQAEAERDAAQRAYAQLEGMWNAANDGIQSLQAERDRLRQALTNVVDEIIEGGRPECVLDAIQQIVDHATATDKGEA